MLQVKPSLLILFLIALGVFVVFDVDEETIRLEGNQWSTLRMYRSPPWQSEEKAAVDRRAPKVKTLNEAFPQKLERSIPLGCQLRKMDPWDKSILYWNDPNWKPKCDKNQTQITELKYRRLILNKTGLATDYFCEGRCLLTAQQKTDWNFEKAPWQNITTFRADCDVVEVRCGSDPSKEIEYNFLHTQIFERKDTPTYANHTSSSFAASHQDTKLPVTTSDRQRPNIYVIVFDSTSTSEFVRSMSRTLYLMKEQHQAVTFQHMNKVGINSRPNAWTLMFGKQIYELGKNPYTEEIFPDLNDTMSCDSTIDGEDFWMHRFRDIGYHTMMLDDWATGTINWPNCEGFQRPPAKHYMKPFQRRNEEKGSDAADALRNTIKDMCHETYEDTMLYLDQFMSAYRGQSEIAFLWNNNLAHDYANGLYHADDKIYRMLMNHEERLNNSFVFIMGDHGMRFGGIRRTDVGELEDNNPFLMVSVPVQFRESDLMKVLRRNSKKLMTHYDTYASIMHLAQLARTDGINELLDPRPEVFSAGHGSSYFCRAMNEPRDCATLRIPYEFCLCEKKFEKSIPANSSDSTEMANFAVSNFQRMIDEQKVTKKCQKLSLKQSDTVVKRLILADGREVYSLKLTVLPSEGIFSGYVEVEREGGKISTISMMSKRFERINSYGEQGDCVKKFEDLRPVCYCVDQKKSSS